MSGELVPTTAELHLLPPKTDKPAEVLNVSAADTGGRVIIAPLGTSADSVGWTDLGWIDGNGVTITATEPESTSPALRSWGSGMTVTLSRRTRKPDWIVITPPGRETSAYEAAKGLPNCAVFVSEQCPPDSLFVYNAAAMRGDWPPGAFDD